MSAVIFADLARADEPLIIAHRGASAVAPENTLAAFRLAWKRGADGIEGDFWLSKDGHIVCIHDKDTERTAGAKHLVAASTLAELRRLDVGKWKGVAYERERIPTLGEVLDVLPEGKQFFIEIKCGPEVIDPLAAVLTASEHKRPGLRKQLTIISFNAEVIAGCRKRFPDIPANWLTSFQQHRVTGRWTPEPDSVLATLKRCGATGLGCKAVPEVVNAAMVRRLRAAKLQFHCWTVNEPALARRFAELGVDSITTDVPAAIRRVLE